jgi:hypothetical protein
MVRRRQPLISRLFVIAATFLAASLGAGGRAQTPAKASTGLLMGVIVDGVTAQPAANAQVTLGGATSTVNNTTILTDAEGRFVFLDLPPGTYTVTASKAGYSDGAYGRRRPGGQEQTLSLPGADRIGDLKIAIWKHGAITGTIRDEAGEPMVDLPVRVLLPAFVAGKLKLTPGAVARTDDRGLYRIGSLAPGDYVVVVPSTQASAPQSVVDVYQQLRGTSSGPGAVDFYRDLSFSGATETLNLLMRPGTTKVGSLAFASSSGIMRAGIVPSPSSDGTMFVYPTQYFPAAMTAGQATTITLRSGEERADVDVQLRLLATSRVSGTVNGPSGPLVVTMTLTPEASEPATDTGLETATTLSDAAGRFTFLGVPPGQYQLRAIRAEVPPSAGSSRGAPPPAVTQGQPPRPALGGYTLSATQSVAVGATDVDGLAVVVRVGFRVSGRAEFPNTATPPEPDLLRRMSATFDPVDARPLAPSTIGRGQFDEDGHLSSYQLTPGRYYLRINNPPAGWTLTSALWNGRDISNVPLDLDRDVNGVAVTFTDRPTTLSGEVQNTAGAPDTSATVLVFPADPASWVGYGNFPRRLRALRVNRDGRYLASGLPAGKYLIAAIMDEASFDWQNPRTLQALARLATAVTLADGDSRQQALRTIAVVAR